MEIISCPVCGKKGAWDYFHPDIVGHACFNGPCLTWTKYCTLSWLQRFKLKRMFNNR
jgi:hypothetical protein